VAARTPWLDQLRWAARHQFWLSLLPVLVIVAAAQLTLDRPAVLILVIAAAIALPAMPYARRVISWAKDPEGSAARTALVLAVRAAPENGPGLNYHRHSLKELASAVTAAGDFAAGLDTRTGQIRQSRLRLLAIVSAMGATLLVITLSAALMG
jgi:hypothetical protein